MANNNDAVLKSRRHSLRKSLIIVLLISSLIPTVLIGAVSYYTIHNLLRNKIENVIENDLHQVRIRLENSLHNLDEVSKQLAFDSRLVNDIEEYFKTEDVMEKYILSQKIKGSLTLINDTSYNLGMMFYYFPNKDGIMFSGLKPKINFDMEYLPLFSEERGVSFYGPHETAFSSVNNSVFSVARKVDITKEECYIYVETNSKLFEEIMSGDRKAFDISYIIANDKGKVVFSSKDEYPMGSSIPAETLNKGRFEEYGLYGFIDPAAQGWKLISIMNKKEYNQAIIDWAIKFFLIGFGSLIISIFFGLTIWYVVYRPLKNLHKELALVSESKFDSEVKLTGIQEFDELLDRFKYTRQRVVELLSEAEQKERVKSQLEVEKLLHQINPHFLHNTLNTIQWIARMNGQEEIDRLVALFTKVLHYNLGKEGGRVTLKEELEALQNYVDLQRIRYDYQFKVNIHYDTDIELCSIPRFILQPLVENALYHGLKDDYGTIDVSARKIGDCICIEVRDDGEGMTEEEIEKLLSGENTEHRKVGMGIGVSYVERMIKVNYRGKGKLEIISTPGNGTTFRLTIPFAINNV